MSIFALLLAASTPAPAGDDIVVIAQRFQGLTATVTRDASGKFGCALSDTSGSAKLDGQLCKAATKCVRKGAAASAEVKACIDGAKPKLIADFRRSYQAQP